VIKERMRWVDHVVGMGAMKSAYKISVGNEKGRDRLEDLGICERIILKLIYK
jgi:hypothetical protein